MKPMISRWLPMIFLLLAPAFLAGCIQAPDDSPNDSPQTTPTPTTPAAECVAPIAENAPSSGGQSSVSNQPGAFSYSGQSSVKTAKEDYLWTNPGTKAGVQWAGQAATGELRLILFDACNQQVYDSAIGPGQGSMTRTTNGQAQPGDWLIRLEFTTYTGQTGLSITSN